MKKALFLDRDGVINFERGDYTWKKEDFILHPDIIPALKIANQNGYICIGITNQGGIAKGIYSHEEFNRLNNWMFTELNNEAKLLQDLFYCPHHPDFGKCLCRKPDSLLLERAIARYQINPKLSWMIGDQDRDCTAAEKLGIKSIKIESNSSLLAILEKIC